jgi:sulfite exporter TauE/SafE
MDAALILGAGLMGLAGAPHCAMMCGAPCAAVMQRCAGAPRGGALAGFAAGRLLGYGVGGAVVAASVSSLALLTSAAPVLRPLWTLMHLAVLGLGLWLLVMGRQPTWWTSLGQRQPETVAVAAGWQRVAAPLRATALGSLWVALPCGLLQSALLVAALANTPLQGAVAMGAFATTSSLGLLLPGGLWARSPVGALAAPWVVRASGALLAAAASGALFHDLWVRAAAWCQTL